MDTIEIILKGFIIGWILSHFEPLQDGLSYIKSKISDKYCQIDKYYMVHYLKTAVSCHKCISFWITLTLLSNFDIFISALTAFIAYVWDSKINPFIDKKINA